MQVAKPTSSRLADGSFVAIAPVPSVVLSSSRLRVSVRIAFSLPSFLCLLPLYACIGSIRSTESVGATLTVRNLDDDVVRTLRVRAGEHGRGAEAEHREILRQALPPSRELSSQNAAAECLAEF